MGKAAASVPNTVPNSARSRDVQRGYVFSPTDVENMARIAHETNRAVCVTLDDYSIQPWDNTDPATKAGCRLGVQKVIENLSVRPIEMHQSWMDHKASEGWKFGSVKDLSRKEHPNIVPYDELDPRQKSKDEFFLAVVRAYIDHKQANAAFYSPALPGSDPSLLNPDRAPDPQSEGEGGVI